jgi:hypothetical protein
MKVYQEIDTRKNKINTQQTNNKLMEVVMSRNILRSALLVAIVMIALSGITLAQGWGGAITNMNASAEVYTILSLTKVTALNFGDILSTSAPVIDPTNTTGDVAVGLHTSNTAHAAGKFHIAGTAAKSVSVTFPATATLTGPSSTMTWTLAVSAAAADAGPRGGAAYTTGTAFSLSASGDYYLWVGGNLGSLSGQAPGVYTGIASFDVEYN